MQTDIDRLEREFAAARPPAQPARALVPRLLLAVIFVYESFAAYRRGEYMFDVLFAIVLTWMAMEYDQSLKTNRLHWVAAKIIAYHKKQAAK